MQGQIGSKSTHSMIHSITCDQTLGTAEDTAQVHPERLTRALLAAAASRGTKVVMTVAYENTHLIGFTP